MSSVDTLVKGGASSEWERDGIRFHYATQRGAQFKAQSLCVCAVCACVFMYVILDVELKAWQMLENRALPLSCIPALSSLYHFILRQGLVQLSRLP